MVPIQHKGSMRSLKMGMTVTSTLSRSMTSTRKHEHPGSALDLHINLLQHLCLSGTHSPKLSSEPHGLLICFLGTLSSSFLSGGEAGTCLPIHLCIYQQMDNA